MHLEASKVDWAPEVLIITSCCVLKL